MIYLTFKHSRIIFDKNEFQRWIKVWFPSARFEGCEYGNHYPTIKVSLEEFEKWKSHFMECETQKENLIKIKGVFSVLEFLTFGVRNFANDLREIENTECLIKIG